MAVEGGLVLAPDGTGAESVSTAEAAVRIADRIAGQGGIVGRGVIVSVIAVRRVESARRARRRARFEKGTYLAVGRVVGRRQRRVVIVDHFAQCRLGRGGAVTSATAMHGVRLLLLLLLLVLDDVAGRQRHRLVDRRHQNRFGVGGLFLRQQFRIVLQPEKKK